MAHFEAYKDKSLMTKVPFSICLVCLSLFNSACAPTDGTTSSINCSDQSITVQEAREDYQADGAFHYYALTPAPAIDPACTQVGEVWVTGTEVEADVLFSNPLCNNGFDGTRAHINTIRITNGRYRNEFEFYPNALAGLLPHCTAGRLFIDGLAPDIQFEMNGDIHFEEGSYWVDPDTDISSVFYSIYESNLELENVAINGLDPIVDFVRDFVLIAILDNIDREVSIAFNQMMCLCDTRPPVGEEDYPLYVGNYDPR